MVPPLNPWPVGGKPRQGDMWVSLCGREAYLVGEERVEGMFGWFNLRTGRDENLVTWGGWSRRKIKEYPKIPKELT